MSKCTDQRQAALAALRQATGEEVGYIIDGGWREETIPSMPQARDNQMLIGSLTRVCLEEVIEGVLGKSGRSMSLYNGPETNGMDKTLVYAHPPFRDPQEASVAAAEIAERWGARCRTLFANELHAPYLPYMEGFEPVSGRGQ